MPNIVCQCKIKYLSRLTIGICSDISYRNTRLWTYGGEKSVFTGIDTHRHVVGTFLPNLCQEHFYNTVTLIDRLYIRLHTVGSYKSSGNNFPRHNY